MEFPSYLLHQLGLDGRALNPEEIYIDPRVFDAQIAANGDITQPSKPKMNDGYWYYLFGIQAYIEAPGVAVENHVNVFFNMKRAHRGNIFEDDQIFATYLDILGTNKTQPMLYRLDGRDDLTLTFSRRSSSTWAGGAARRVGVIFFFLAVAKKLIP